MPALKMNQEKMIRLGPGGEHLLAPFSDSPGRSSHPCIVVLLCLPTKLSLPQTKLTKPLRADPLFFVINYTKFYYLSSKYYLIARFCQMVNSPFKPSKTCRSRSYTSFLNMILSFSSNQIVTYRSITGFGFGRLTLCVSLPSITS